MELGRRWKDAIRELWNGWLTRTSTTESMIKRWCCTRSCSVSLMPTLIITHTRLRASSTWRTMMKPNKLHWEANALNLATFPQCNVFLAVPHAWLLSNRDSQYAILSILIVWVFIKKKNLRLKDCRLQLKRNYTYVCISEGPRTLHIPSAKLWIADDQVPRVHCRSAYCFT